MSVDEFLTPFQVSEVLTMGEIRCLRSKMTRRGREHSCVAAREDLPESSHVTLKQ
jgi:hypothetical protein